jgi:hypothetical protein
MSEVFAAGTKVPVEKTRMELEQLLAKHKARSTAFFNAEGEAKIAFEMADRRILFRIGLPKGDSERERRTKRERWRALLLSIKAKLVSVQSGIETFEDAFLAHVMMPDGQTVGEHARPRIAAAYKDPKHAPPLLPPPKGGE